MIWSTRRVNDLHRGVRSHGQLPAGPSVLSQHYIKTDDGRDEIRTRERKLARPARNLLLIIDGTRSAADWVELVHSASEQDFAELLVAGLVEPAAAQPRSARGPEPKGPTLDEALARFSYEQLYAWLTSQARERLGLIRGYQTVLEIEKCANVDELRGLVKRFLTLVEQRHGLPEARKVRAALGARD